MRVLVVEDHVELAETIAAGLRREGMAIDTVHDGKRALVLADLYDYDVIVLDRDLPGLHGDRVCERLTGGDGRARILMLTASGADRRSRQWTGARRRRLPAQAVRVRRAGGEDPRARATCPAGDSPRSSSAADLQLDTARRVARRGGASLDLSAKELAVLELLMAADGAVISTEELLARAWDEAADPFTNVVKVTISRLRRKLGEPPVIETVPGAGYRI